MPAIRAFALGLVIALTMTAAIAADSVIKLNEYSSIIVPAGSPVTFSSFKKEDINAYFKGTFVMSGTWHVGGGSSDGQATDYADPWFEPDAVTVALLPYWKNYSRAKHVTFDNSQDFMKAVVPPKDLAKLQHGKPATLSGHATIKVDHYTMNITCDYPYYYAHFLSVVQPTQLLARRKGVDDNGC